MTQNLAFQRFYGIENVIICWKVQWFTSKNYSWINRFCDHQISLQFELFLRQPTIGFQNGFNLSRRNPHSNAASQIPKFGLQIPKYRLANPLIGCQKLQSHRILRTELCWSSSDGHPVYRNDGSRSEKTPTRHFVPSNSSKERSSRDSFLYSSSFYLYD